jgi:hypothetical protein
MFNAVDSRIATVILFSQKGSTSLRIQALIIRMKQLNCLISSHLVVDKHMRKPAKYRHIALASPFSGDVHRLVNDEGLK